MASVRIYQKKEIRLDRLNFRQTQMFKIGNVGVAAVKNRLAAAQGPTDGAAKPLTKRTTRSGRPRLGKGNRRNLMLTGDMLRNFQVRTVSENKAKASNSTRKDRLKAWITSKIEPWVVFSPKNRAAVDADRAAGARGDARRGWSSNAALGGKQHDRHLCSGRQSRRDAARHSRTGRGDGRRPGADLRVPRPVPEEGQPRARDPPDARAVDHGGLAGHAPGSFGGFDVWKHQVTLFLRARETFDGDPPTPYYRMFRLITKGVPARGGAADAQHARSTPPATRWTCRRSSGRRMRRGWTTSKFRLRSRRSETTDA